MQRGSIITYDLTGKIFSNSGDAEGSSLSSNVLPVGIPYIETQFGEYDGKRLISVDIKTKTLITEDIVIPMSAEQQRIAELENIILESEGLV